MRSLLHKLIQRLPAVTLLAVSILFWSQYDRYESSGAFLLQSPPLSAASFLQGEISETTDGLILKASENDPPAHLQFPIPAIPPHRLVRVRAGISVEVPQQRPSASSCTRICLRQYGPDNEPIDTKSNLASLSGSHAWKQHEKVFKIHSRTLRAELILYLPETNGTARIDHLEIQPVQVRTSFRWWRAVFACLWITAAIIYFKRCRLHDRRLRLPIFLNVLIIIIGTLLPYQWIHQASDQVKGALEQAEDPYGSTAKNAAEPPDCPVIRLFNNASSIGHFILFASLCFLIYLSAALEKQPPFYYVKVGGDLLHFAAITEALQFITPDRTATLCDLRTDVYGLTLALLLFLLIYPLIRKGQNRSFSEE
jgi:hypothetical protein